VVDDRVYLGLVNPCETSVDGYSLAIRDWLYASSNISDSNPHKMILMSKSNIEIHLNIRLTIGTCIL